MNKGSRRWNEINIYDYRKDSLKSRDIKRIFGGNKLYWDERKRDETHLEKNMSKKIEGPVSIVFNRIINTEEDQIDLSNAEIDLIRRFFLLTLTRLPIKPTPEKGWEKNFELHWKQFTPSQREIITRDQMANIYPNLTFKLQSNDSGKIGILDDIDIIINNDFKDIIKHPECSVNLARKFRPVEIADIGIWKCGDNDDFMISDTYLTNEGDRLIKDYDSAIMQNHLYLFNLYEKYKHDQDLAKIIENRLKDQEIFHENIWFMPISPKHMIVLINPFYRGIFGELCTIATDYEVFRWIPELYLRQVSTRDESSNIFEIQQVDIFVTRYINTLIMDRVQNFFGFKNIDGIRGSVELYQEMVNNQFGIKNYEKLHNRFKKE